MINEICFSDVLLESVKEIFERATFMPVDEVSETHQEIKQETLLGLITFKGALEGCLAVCCGLPCAKAIAANMLGIDAADEMYPEEISDAIGEVANMIIRGVKSRVCENTGNIEISIPSVISGHEFKNSLGDGASEVSIEVIINGHYPARFSLWYRACF